MTEFATRKWYARLYPDEILPPDELSTDVYAGSVPDETEMTAPVDGILEFTVEALSTGSYDYFMFRAESITDNQLGIRNEDGADEISIYKIISGSASLLTTVTHTLIVGDVISIRMIGSEISIFMNGDMIYSFTETELVANTKAYVYYYGSGSFADVKSWTYDEEEGYGHIDMDITPYVMASRNISVARGMATNDEMDRLAKSGEMVMVMNNTDGYWDPESSTAISGWDKGTLVTLVLTYDGEAYTAFKGTVSTLDLNDEHAVFSTVTVRMLDWMQYIEKFPIREMEIQTYKKAGDAIQTIIDEIPTAPSLEVISPGQQVFDALFDSVTTQTLGSTEANKIVKSEPGYFYQRADKTNGEKLIFEDRADRTGLRALSLIPTGVETELLAESDSTELLAEDDSEDLLAEGTEDAIFAGTEIQKISRSRGKHLVNRVKVTVHPKHVDTSAVVLFNLDSPIKIRSGGTVEFSGVYSNPEGGRQVNAITSLMIDPVATTDYLAYRYKNGSGTNMTTDLTVEVTFGTEAPHFRLTNGGSTVMWVTFLQTRGYGVYQDNPITVTEEDTTSQDAHGVISEDIDQQYQREIWTGELLAQIILARDKDPHNSVDTVKFCANTSARMMYAFLTLDVGDLVNIDIDSKGIDDWCYIQRKQFEIKPGGIIWCTWTLKKMESVDSGALSLIGVEISNGGAEEVVSWGNLPELIDLTQQSLSAWVYPKDGLAIGNVVCAWIDDEGGLEWQLRYDAGSGYRMFVVKVYTGGGGIWYSSYSADIAMDSWAHVGMTIDRETVKFYAGGALLTTSIDIAAGGAPKSLDGMTYSIGNIRSVDPLSDYGHPFVGILADVRHYKGILSDANMAQIESEGIGGTGMRRGLLFQGPCVRTHKLSYFTDRTLTAADRLIENIHGYVGTPSAGVDTRILT